MGGWVGDLPPPFSVKKKKKYLPTPLYVGFKKKSFGAGPLPLAPGPWAAGGTWYPAMVAPASAARWMCGLTPPVDYRPPVRAVLHCAVRS
jgi:hypothetical protein